MKFGSVPVSEAAGAILAHSLDLGGRRLRKGVLLDAEHVSQMQVADVSEVVVARLEPGDVPEDEAASVLAQALVPDSMAADLTITKAFTGRVNLLAKGSGVAVLDVAAIEALNRVHPMITLATVPQHTQMNARGMLATIKIISYAVPGKALEQVCACARESVKLARPKMQSASLIITDIPGGAGEKGRGAIEARITALGLKMADVLVIPHTTAGLAEGLKRVGGDLTLILTGSATSDEKDVGPAALRAAGGHVARFGMPVDPGNLLFLGDLSGRPVIGLPGCARSPAINGADWVLSRVVCGIEVTANDIAGMGVGGLLKEIPTRPQPRHVLKI
ncbi:MAG: molybdopterin-binding protein [Paracoccaceae bacterium]